MAEAAAVTTHCCQGTPATYGRSSSEGHFGIHVQKHVKELPAVTSKISRDALPLRLGGAEDPAVLSNVHGHDAEPNHVILQPSSEMNTEIKNNESLGMASDASVDKPSKQANISHCVEEIHRKEGILHGDGDHEIGGSVTDNKQVKIQEETLGDIHALDDISNAEECKKAKRNDLVHTSAVDPIINSEPATRDISIRAPLETNTTSHVEHLNTSIQQEVHSLQQENPNNVGKKKKRKTRQLAQSESLSAEETTKSPIGATVLSESTGHGTYNVELTSRDEPEFKTSVLLSSLELNDGNLGGKSVQFGSDALASTDVISEQGNLDRVHKDYSNPSIADVINSTAEVLASDGGEKLESHDEGVAEISNMEKDGKNTDALENKHTSNTSQLKKHKKAKKVRSVDIAPMDADAETEMHGYRENAAKLDKVSTEREVVHDPSMRQISSNVQQGDMNIIENPSGDGKRKKKRKHHTESSKVADPSPDLIKPSEFVTNESSIQVTESAPLDANQTTKGSMEGVTVSDGGMEGVTVSDHQKLGESLDIAAAAMIDEVLTDLKSKGSSSNDLDGDLLTGQTHVGSNPDPLELPESTGDKVGTCSAPLQYAKAIHSNAPVGSPSHKKSKGKQLKALSAMIESSHCSNGGPEEDANTEVKETDALKFSHQTSDLKDILTGDVVAQVDDKTKGTKRPRKKISLKQVPADDGKGKANQSSDKQVNQVTNVDLKGVNATQADLVQEGSVIDTPSSTVGKVQKKGKRSSKTRAPKVQETNHSSHGQDLHLAKDSQDENAIGITGTHAGDPTELPVDQKDATTLKSSSPKSRKKRKKSSNTELQSQGSALEQCPTSDLDAFRAEKGIASPKSSAEAFEPNDHIVVHPASDSINVLDQFSSGKMIDPSVSAENEQNNEDGTIREVQNTKKHKRKQGTGKIESHDLLESLRSTDKTSLTDHFGTNEGAVPSITVENMNKEYENVKSSKEKTKRKKKPNLEELAAEKEYRHAGHHGTDIGTQGSLDSTAQNRRMRQDDENENSNKVTQNVSIMQQEPEDATCHRTLEKELHQSDVDNQKNLPIDKDNSQITNELRKATSQKKPHAKNSNLDESINGRMGQDPKAVSNLVKSFSMSSPPSSESAEGTPLNANRYRLTVRKVPIKRYEQAREKFKRESRKLGSGAIFKDAVSKGSDDAVDTKSEKTAMETSSDNSSTSADSGISSAAYESEVPDDDDAVSLSQKSRKKSLHIGSILRGSSSFKKAKQKRAEDLDDDIEVPDSQPPDGLWSWT